MASTLASAAAPSSDVGALVVVVVRPAPGRLPLIRPANPLPAVVVVDDEGEAADVTSTLDDSPSFSVVIAEAEAAVVVEGALPAPGRLPPKRLDKPADGTSAFSPCWTGLAVVVVVVRPAPGRRPFKSPANPVLAVAAVVESTATGVLRAVLVRTAGLRAISPANVFVAVVELTAPDEDSVTAAAAVLVDGRLPPNEDAVVNDSIAESEVSLTAPSLISVVSSTSCETERSVVDVVVVVAAVGRLGLTCSVVRLGKRGAEAAEVEVGALVVEEVLRRPPKRPAKPLNPPGVPCNSSSICSSSSSSSSLCSSSGCSSSSI